MPTSTPFDIANAPAGWAEKVQNAQRARDLRIGGLDVMKIPPSIIQVEAKHNPRDYRLPENRAHLDELKRSIAVEGVIQPLLCRYDFLKPGDDNKSLIVVDGECRLRAVKELLAEGHELASVPVLQVEGKNEGDRLLTAITANQGKPLSQWELGNAFKRFQKLGWEVEQIVTRTGYKKEFIEKAIELTDAPDEVKFLLSEQAVTPSLAIAELRRSGSGAALILRQKVEEQRAKGKKGPVKRERTAPPKAASPKNDPAVKEVARLLKMLFKELTPRDLAEENEYVSVRRDILQSLQLKYQNLL